MSTQPGGAEFVISRLTIRGRLCPHNPKLVTTTSAGTPSCLGFFFQVPNTILLLKTSCLCRLCYDNAVPSGYNVFSPPSGNPASPRSSDLKCGIQWWNFRSVGLEIYGIPESIRMPLNTSTDDHQALQLFSNQGQPFYMPLFHTLGKFVPKSLTERDLAKAHQYGNIHRGLQKLAAPLVPTAGNGKTAQAKVLGSFKSGTAAEKRDIVHTSGIERQLGKEDNISPDPHHGGQRRTEPLVQSTQRGLNSQPGFSKTTNIGTGILQSNPIRASTQVATMSANSHLKTTHQTSSGSAAVASTSFQVSTLR